jgi:hypothetical protein
MRPTHWVPRDTGIGVLGVYDDPYTDTSKGCKKAVRIRPASSCAYFLQTVTEMILPAGRQCTDDRYRCVNVMIQLVSHVLPPSSENACSH